jgi:uncharacterized protein YbbC (DUF1343 family)
VTVYTGLDVLIANDFKPLAGGRIGLFTNPSAVDRSLRRSVDIFRAAHASGQINLSALFAPEHGLDAAAQDGVKVASSALGGIPVHSLYADNIRPTHAMLDGLDLLVCDIQDIGVRYYTFLWTITHILEAAGEHDVPVLILDRPNPLGGLVVDGAPLDPAFASLVGRFSLPTRHGMTLAEVARLFNTEWNPTPASLSIIPCSGWRRAMRWADTGLVFVPPSPNMPHLEAVEQYPGSCLIEGTTLSEGRGTTLPFQIVGAPYIDGMALADLLNALNLPGVRFRPHSFQPAASKWAGERCGGVQAHVLDAQAWQPLRAWLTVIASIGLLYPDQFEWLPPAENGVYHFDRLIGSSEPRRVIHAGAPLNDLLASWADFSRAFTTQREPYLLYE